MEEDIKILEERIKKSRQLFEEVGSHMFFNKEIITIIENLLKRYKELEEENEKLKIDIEVIKTISGVERIIK